MSPWVASCNSERKVGRIPLPAHCKRRSLSNASKPMKRMRVGTEHLPSFPSAFSLVKSFNCLGTCPFHVVAVTVGHLFEKSGNVRRWVQGKYLLDFACDPSLPARQ